MLESRPRGCKSPRVKRLLPSILLLAACGGSKPQTVPAPPPNPTPDVVQPTQPVAPTPPANNDAELVAEAKQFVVDTDKELRQLMTDSSVADWANQTDITPDHEAASAKASEALSNGIT